MLIFGQKTMHLLSSTTELTLVCINSIESIKSMIFIPECLFFCLRLLLTHEVHLLHYIQCLSRFHVVTFHSVCRINFDEILFICFLKSRIGKTKTITIMEFPSQMSKSIFFCYFRTSFYTEMAVLTVITKLYIPSTLSTDYLLWHTQLIVCAVKY